jgi:hypothetical protein
MAAIRALFALGPPCYCNGVVFNNALVDVLCSAEITDEMEVGRSGQLDRERTLTKSRTRGPRCEEPLADRARRTSTTRKGILASRTSKSRMRRDMDQARQCRRRCQECRLPHHVHVLGPPGREHALDHATLMREVGASSLSPFRSDSPLNVDDSGTSTRRWPISTGSGGSGACLPIDGRSPPGRAITASGGRASSRSARRAGRSGDDHPAGAGKEADLIDARIIDVPKTYAGDDLGPWIQTALDGQHSG